MRISGMPMRHNRQRLDHDRAKKKGGSLMLSP
jgi:hypothetical protein